MLTELAASHLFVEAVGSPGRWYPLHRLVADILRARPMPPRQRRDLHRRAAEWFRDHRMPLEAVRQALRGGLWPLAAELIGINLAPFVLHGTAHELERLLDQIPRAVLLERPELAAGLAAARVAQGIGTEVSALVDAARARAGQLKPVRAARVGTALDFIVAGTARMSGDMDTALRAFGRLPHQPAALARLGLAEPEIISAVVRSNLGAAQLWTGDLDEAAANLRVVSPPGSAFPHLNAAAHLALLHSERGELGVAEALAREVTATAAARGWARTTQAACAYLAMSRVLLDRDELAAFDDWLRRLEEILSVAPQPHVRLASALLLAGRREAAGDREHALAGLRATAEELGPWTPPRVLAEQQILTEAALLARLGAAASARDRLDALGRPHTATGVATAARVRLLLGHPPRAELSPQDVDAAVIDPLTEREQTILRYLGSTLNSAEIAAELYVSLNTVKTHQRSVYRKLGATGRRDAVRRARTLHLL
jgi:LuxR family transcriptional regulator, maltose regulon positive regulatory protein